MARGAGKRIVSGWLIVDKPAGITSTSVVNKVKWAFNAKKAGHAGTLDPDATGLLAVALGEATKTVPYVTDDLKAYEFLIRFGSATNTDDAEGEIIKQSDIRPTDAEIEAALPTFTGDIQQVPPQFSAIKINGERAYKLARSGEEVEIAARPLHVDSLQMLERVDKDHALLEMVCGKGGYVRSIARDLGEALGSHAHVRHLRRMWSGPFDLDNCITLETVQELAKTPDLDAYLRPIEAGLSDLPELTCRPEAAAKLRVGNAAMVISSGLEYGDLAWVSCDGEPIAIGNYKAGELHPIRVFVPA
jgi:tRNA pseudouridine55 synthase